MLMLRSHPSCVSNVWAQAIFEIMGKLSFSGASALLQKRSIADKNCFSVFSALRAYALSNRNKWLAAVIVLSALPPSVMLIVRDCTTLLAVVCDLFGRKLVSIYEAPANLPSPYNCSASSTLPPMFSLRYVIPLTTCATIHITELITVPVVHMTFAYPPFMILIPVVYSAHRWSGVTAYSRAARHWHYLVVHLPIVSHRERHQNGENYQFLPHLQW